MTSPVLQPLPATKPARLNPDSPRILLFGLPRAGKSALLGALARVAEIQERIFGGRITDINNGLRGLREQVYNGRPPATQEELVAHPIRIEPFLDGRADGAERFDVALLDCDGRKAAALTNSAGGGMASFRPGTLGDQMYQADAVLFVLDASATENQVDTDLAEFSRFLVNFRKERGRRTDEPELPIWLVLAQCDKLARPGDTLAVWTERVEARKEQVAQRFEEVLKQKATPSFGTVSFAAAVTAVKQPKLANASARPDEPYGVAELFRDAAISARSFRAKKHRGELNIRRLVVAAGMVVAAVAGFAAVSPIVRDFWKPPAVLTALRAYRNNEGPPPAGYLSEPLDGKIDTLQLIKRDEEFGRLSEADQTFVNERADELQRFRSFSATLRKTTSPAEVRDLEELQQLDQRLRGEWAPPEKHAAAWNQTEAGQTRERWLADIAAVGPAVQATITAYDTQRQEIDRLYVVSDDKPDWPVWAKRVNDMLNAGPPVAKLEATVSAAQIASFTEVSPTKRRWEASRQRLVTLHNIASLLRLIPGDGPTLVVSDSFTRAQAPALFKSIHDKYPKAASWGNPDVPDAAMSDIKAAARGAYQKLLPSGRAALTAAYGPATDGPESLARWRTAAETAAGDPNFRAWNELARLALRLTGDNTDPAGEMAAFLRRDDFPLELQGVDFIQATASTQGLLVPTGSWILFVQDPQGRVVKKPYRAPDDPKGERIRFLPADGKPLTYRPGDLLWAELGVMDKNKADVQVTWWASGVRSKLYQFDRLNRLPRIHKLEQRAEEGRPLEGVRLEFLPPGALPQVPDLFPEDLKAR